MTWSNGAMRYEERVPAKMTLSLALPDIATCMYYTGLDPFTGKEMYIVRHLRHRKLEGVLLQCFNNYTVAARRSCRAGRADVIGSGCDCLIPPSRRRRPSRREGGGRMRQPVTTITTRWRTRRRASRPATRACRIKATGPPGSRDAAKTANASGKDNGSHE